MPTSAKGTLSILEVYSSGVYNKYTNSDDIFDEYSILKAYSNITSNRRSFSNSFI